MKTIKRWAGMTALLFISGLSFGGATGQSGAAYQNYLKALLLESQGNFEAAHEELEKALAVAPENAYLHRTAAEMSLRLGQVNQAAEEIEKAIELDPDNVRALIISGQINWAIGDTDKAIVRLRKALSIDPDESDALVSLAGALTPKKPKEAIKLYKEFLERHPNEPEIQERLAQVYQATNEIEKAKSTWKDVLAISPNSVRAHLALAQIAEVHFDTATAISHYEGVLTQDPTNLPLLLRVGELRYRSDDMAKANEAFLKAHVVAPDSPGVNFWLALLAENRGDWDEAVRHLKNVPEGNQETGVLLRLSYYYSQAGKPKEAIKVLKTLSDGEPTNIDFLNYLAAGYEQDKQIAKAENTLKKVIALDENDADAHFRLGTLYDRSGRFPKAEVEMRTAIRLNPRFHMALNYLGYSMADKKLNLIEAEQMVMEAIALDPKNPAYMDSMGWVYYRQGKFEKAKDFLREAIEQARDHTIFDHYGDVMMATGEVSEAILSWDESLRIDPTTKEVRTKINNAMKRISVPDKVELFTKRAISSFGDNGSIKSLVRVSVCESGPCADANAQFSYERNNFLNIEIPGPLMGPVMQLHKKKGQPATYGAIHPQFQTVEFFVTRAFDRIEPLLSAEMFKKVDLAVLKEKAVEKKGTITVKSGNFELVFDATSGAIKSLTWDDGEAFETILLGKYETPQSPVLPAVIEWRYSQPAFRMKLNFIKPVLSQP